MRTRHKATGLASASKRKSTVFFRARNSTNWLFPKSPKSSARASSVWTSFTSLRDFYFDISEWHILTACAWTPAFMLLLTNPCAKRKVLSLTKPKGKIYKTKSLGHYITGYLKSNSSLAGRIKDSYNLMGINLKMNLITLLKFELTCFDIYGTAR